MSSYYSRYTDSLGNSLRTVEITDLARQGMGADAGFEVFCRMTREVQAAGRRQFLCGNGASAAFANHMALDWTKNGKVPTHSFSDSALLTALGNDFGYLDAFAAPLGWYASSGDLLVTISSSGNSPNILKTIEAAREKGMGVVTFSGLNPQNASRQSGDLNFYIPAKTYGIVECAHQVLLHVWLDRFMEVCEWDRSVTQNMNKENYVG